MGEERSPASLTVEQTEEARRTELFRLVGWLALVVFGVFSIADSLFAMDCAPNSDTTCALRERAGKVSFAHQFHSVTSVCVVTAGIISLIALTVASRRHRRLPVIARWSWLLLWPPDGPQH